MIIVIDGFSGTGKGTLAKDLSKYLGYIYIDTGAMYRAVTFFALQKNIIGDKSEIVQSLEGINISFDKDNQTLLNGVNIEKDIRGIEVSNKVSTLSKIKEVRNKLIGIQRELGKKGNVVMDGRDIGSVVFPNADIKIFMTCSSEIRAKRRVKDFSDVSYEDILKNIEDRDKMDLEREESPLIKMPDSIELDNSDMTKQQQLEFIINLINKNEESKN